jgi:hypothetical protein
LNPHQRIGNVIDFKHLRVRPVLADGVQFSLCLHLRGDDWSAVLTTAIDNTVSSPVTVSQAPARKKHGWLPLLTVLFLISYGLMTMLIVEQGRTIESQRALIRDLFRDSTELAAAKRALPEKNVEVQHRAENPASKTLTPETRDSQTTLPSTQAPAKQAPSPQAAPQHRAQSQTTRQKPQFQMPSRPASDLSDDRRALITI